MPSTNIERNGASARLELSQPLTLSLAQELRPQVKDLLAAGVTELVLDLAQVELVDSSGIGFIIATQNTLKKSGGRLRVTGASAEIHHLFRTMRLDKHIALDAPAAHLAQA